MTPTVPGSDADSDDALLFPASFAQQRLWFLHKLLPENPAYNIALARQINGKLNLSAVQAAIDQLVARHETLRTRFMLDDGEPMQRVLPADTIRIASDKLDDAQEDSLRTVINELAAQPFDLEHAPLLRVHVLSASESQHLLVIVIHHIIADAWSLGVLYRELTVFYNAACRGESVELPELPIQYGDFADWQHEQANSPAYRTQLDFWRAQLSGAPELLDLPTDRPRPAVQSYNGATVYRELPAGSAQGLHALAKNSGCTFFVTMLAAFSALLSRYAGNTDIVIGTPMSGRDRAELADLIGLFLNTLALRIDLDGNPSFTQLLQRSRTVAFEAFAHPDVPFEKLVDELDLDRHTSYAPVFQAMLVVEQAGESEADMLDGISARAIPFETHTAKFDLTLFISEGAGGTSAIFEYNRDLFDHATIERMLSHFETLIAGIIKAPDAPLDSIALVDERERTTVLTTFNASDTDFGAPVTVAELANAQAAQTPDAVAIRAGDTCLTYAELDRQAAALAAALVAAGAGPGQRVAICCPRDLLLPVAALACIKSGACYVPVDPAYPADRIRSMLADAEPVAIVAHSSVTLPAHAAHLITLDSFDFAGMPATSVNGPRSEDPLYCIYTSGSTGTPKGVQLAHAGLANLLRWQAAHERLGPPARTLQFASFSFDVSFQEMFSTLCSGGELVMISEAQRQDLSALASLIAQEKIERLFLPFAALQPLAEAWEHGAAPAALRDVVVAGEQLKVTGAVRNLFARLEGAALHNQYGPSETHVVTALTMTGASADWPTLPSIGTPVANTRCYVLDASQQPVPVGLPGELYLGGVQVALGYLKRPELDAEKFLPNPFHAGDRLYRTGDRVRWLASGELEFLGRVDDQVKWRGFRIEPGEIEAALTALDAVEDAVVMIRDDTGTQRLVAYVTGDSPDPAALLQALKQSLPEFMQPSIIVPLDEFPLTPSGKVARRALPAPDFSLAQTAPYAAPRTPTEEILVAIWQHLLGVETCSIHDDFFDLGGHSLLATQLVARIRDTLDVEPSLISLFANPTIAEFSAVIDELQGVEVTPAIAPVSRAGNLPLSFAQQRLWFLDQLEPGNPVYNFPIVLELNGELDTRAMQSAIDALVERHESLRTAFSVVDNAPVQAISPAAPIELQQIDARKLSPAEQSTLINDIIQQGFDLNCAPLLRAYLLGMGADKHTLVLVTHHIVSDGWSLGIMLNELASLYSALRTDSASPLSDLPIQYADYALWQRDWLKGAELARQLDYWGKQLDGAPDALDIPTDWPRPSEQTFNGTGRLRQLPAALQQGLHALARQHDCTIYMVLLAAFDVLLARYAGTEDIVVGTPIAGRRKQETEGLVGYFANTLALRNDLSGNPRFSELLERTRKVTLDAYQHQDLPFEKLVEELQPERSLSHSPIFQVMLVMQNNPTQPVNFSGLDYAYPDVEMGIAKFDLLLELTETAEGIRAGMQYNSDLFKPATIDRMLTHFEMLLSAAAADASLRIIELPLVTDSERERVVREFNESAADYGPDACAHRLVEAQAKRTPGAPALNFGGQTLTYSEVNRRANVLAGKLTELGAAPGKIVAISCPRSAELPVAALAVLKSGACYVPVDPAYPPERIDAMLKDTGAPIILSHSAIALPPTKSQVILLDQFDFSGTAPDPDSGVTTADPLYCIYTSGSTGTPKGVQLSHAGLSNLLRWQMQHNRLGSAARTLQFASFSFDVSFQEIFGTWSMGGELVMIDEELRKDLGALAEFIATERIERLYLPFAAFQPIATSLVTNDISSAIRDIIVAGEQLQVSKDIRALFAKLPDAALHNQYGPSETHVVTALTLTNDAAKWPALPSIGTPVGNTHCYVLDAQQQVLPVGLPGELYLGGRQVALGYLNRPEQNRAKFLRSPFDLGERLYRTGDRVRWLDNGELEFLGRVDEQIKWRGFRIEPGEIEATLLKLPDIGNSAVLLREDRPGDQRLVAYVTPAEEHDEPVPEQIRIQLRGTLPDYMVPSTIVVLEQMPLTPSGKVARRKLPAPDYDRDADTPVVAPRNAAEAQLVELWQAILGVPEVSVHDDFFALGGHSLLATQLIARVRDAFSVALPLKYIFRYPSPATLGEVITALKTTSTGPKSATDGDEYEEISL
jgi:amino acid adenylation domain-containing protein